MSEAFPDHSLPRLILGAALSAVSGALLWVSASIDWGVAWTVIIPALALGLLAWGLMGRTRLSIHAGTIEICHGWLWRRAVSVPLAGCAVELLPTAGLYAVVLHRDRQAWPLRVWTTHSHAGRLLAWLDHHHPQGAFPRVAAATPAGDR